MISSSNASPQGNHLGLQKVRFYSHGPGVCEALLMLVDDKFLGPESLTVTSLPVVTITGATWDAQPSIHFTALLKFGSRKA